MNPFFKVERQPLYTEFNGQKLRSNRDALINTENNTIVGEVGHNYQVIPNQEVADVFDTAFKDIKVSSIKDHLSGTTGNWQREIVIDDANFNFNVNGDDSCKLKVIVFNGYTGKRAVGFTVGAYRLVCENGLMGWKNNLSFSLNHLNTGIIDRIKYGFEDKVEVFGDTIKTFDVWSQERFSQDNFNTFLLTRDYLSEKQVDKFKALYITVKKQFNEDDSKWGAYNVLTAISTHYTKARRGSHIFSNGYKTVTKLVKDFAEFNNDSISIG